MFNKNTKKELEIRIEELNMILCSTFDLNTWPNSEGLVFILRRDAWKIVKDAISNINTSHPNNINTLKKKIKETDKTSQAGELYGEIIMLDHFLTIGTIYEYKTNGEKNVDIMIPNINGNILIDITTLNYKQKDREKIDEITKYTKRNSRWRFCIFRN